MLRIPGMPLLPGTTFRDISKDHFPKTQQLMTCFGINMLSDRIPPPLVDPSGMLVDPNCPPPEFPSLYPSKTAPKLPPWLAYDKKCLCFKAYFKETLQEVYHAPYQVRYVKILYYLEDGTMQITEPKVLNSGLPQGCVVHRQRIPKPTPCQHEFVSILDLNVNQKITIFDRVYHITDCDSFTRNFLNRSGIAVPDPIEPPLDPTTEFRKKQLQKLELPHEKKEFGKFLRYERMVLRFSGYWDDRTEFGEVRNLEICFYLVDDTIEIKEILLPNSGREGPKTFLKRSKLQKEWRGLPLPGDEAEKTILNVLGGGLRTGRYIEDPLGTGKKYDAYYCDADLQIGTHMNVYGRNIILTDCDAFTKEWYRKKYGIEDFTPIPHPKTCLDRIAEQKERKLPPYNGWGTYEDSEGNCVSVMPKAPQVDFKKFIEFDKFILRFGAKMMSMIKENCERKFIISYYLSDDTIQIYEICERNSGFKGGVFWKRKRIPLPNQPKFVSKRPDLYLPVHFYIGSSITLVDHVFQVVSADEYTLLFMEAHPEAFALSDVHKIMNKVREALRPKYKEFMCRYMPEVKGCEGDCRYVNYETVKRAMVELLGDNITDHEIITLCRHFSAEKKPSQQCARERVRAAAHMEMKRAIWNNMDHLKAHIYIINKRRKAHLPETKIRQVILACRLPFQVELVDEILSVLNHNSEGEVEICDFLSLIDVQCGNAPDIVPVNIAFQLCPKIPFLSKGRFVDWDCFIKRLGLEEELTKDS